jgi:hypothetical protein
MQKFAASQDALVDWQYLNYADSYQVSFLIHCLRIRLDTADEQNRTHLVATVLRTLLRSGPRPRSTTPKACSRLKLPEASRSPESRTLLRSSRSYKPGVCTFLNSSKRDISTIVRDREAGFPTHV